MLGMAIGAFVTLGLIFGGIWAIGAIGGATLTAPENGEQVESVLSVQEIWDSQRMANELYEVVRGETISQGYSTATSATPAGHRWSQKFAIRNLHESLSLQGSFWRAEATGWDVRGREVEAFAYFPSWGWRPTGVIPPGEQRTGTVLIFGDDLAGYTVTFTYAEPGRSTVSTMFVVRGLP